MLSTVQSWWASASGLELVFAVLGALIGGVFVFSSWKGSLKGTELKNDPRIKSLGWVIASFFAALLGRWEKLLGLKEEADRVRLLLFYTFPLLGAAITVVSIISLIIYLRCKSFKRKNPEAYPDEPFSPVLDYLHYGYQYYLEQFEKALERKRNDRLRAFRELTAMVANQLAGDIIAVDKYHLNPTDELRATVCKHILEHICLIAQAYMEMGSEPNLNASLMVAVPVAQAAEAEWKSVWFLYQERDRYGHLLILRHYANPHGEEQFALPVEDPNLVPDWKDWVLLGAPEAFLRKKELVVRTQDLDFAKNVPQDVRKAIQGYFDGKDFHSFACLIVPKDGRPYGIVNVESTREHIFQESEDAQNEMAKLLQPFCALLGLVAK